MRTAILLALAMLILPACGKGTPQPDWAALRAQAPSPTAKDLFSSWARQSPAGFILDLSSSHFGSNALRLFISSPVSAQCDCVLAISGSQDAGQVVITGCSFVAGSGTDPDCTGLEGAGTYTKTADTLSFCRTGGTCATYK